MRKHKHRCGHEPHERFKSFFDLIDGPPPQQPGCGLVFVEHVPPPTGTGTNVYEKTHTCTNCGVITYWQYRGRLKVGEGKREK